MKRLVVLSVVAILLTASLCAVLVVAIQIKANSDLSLAWNYTLDLRREISRLNGDIVSLRAELEAERNKPPVVETKVVTEYKVVEVEKELREFESLEELKGWLSTANVVIKLVCASDGWAAFPDCDDYASSLQKLAEQAGYRLDKQIVINGMLDGKLVSRFYRGAHNGCVAYIGNDVYYVEVPAPHDVTKVIERD